MFSSINVIQVIPPIPNTVSETCQDFLNQVFRFRPEDRPTAYELLDHPFIRDSLPSLTCIDMEGSQTLQLSQTGIRSIENIQEDIYSRPSSTSKPQSQNDFVENTPKNYQQEQKKEIRNNSPSMLVKAKSFLADPIREQILLL